MCDVVGGSSAQLCIVHAEFIISADRVDHPCLNNIDDRVCLVGGFLIGIIGILNRFDQCASVLNGAFGCGVNLFLSRFTCRLGLVAFDDNLVSFGYF